MSGILLGSKSQLSTDLLDTLRKTSTIHIVVASGQNLSILVGFIKSLRPFAGKNYYMILSFLTIFIYSFIRLQIPIIRAAIMMFFTLLAKVFARENSSTKALLLAAYLMILYEPNWLLSVSFQLSFLPTVGVMVLAPELIKQCKFLPILIKEDLLVTLSAQLLIMPIIAVNFRSISLIGIIVNTLILWTIPLVMISGFITIFAYFIAPILAQLIALIPMVLLTYFNFVVKLLDFDLGVIRVVNFTEIFWVGYFFIFIKQRNELTKVGN